MLKKLPRLLLLLLLLSLCAALLLTGDDVRAAVEEGLRLCFSSVLPSLFPFFVLTSLMTNLGFSAALGRRLSPLMGRLFHLGSAGAAALALGLVGGYPTGARCAAELYDRGVCRKEEAERLLAFCSNCGPAFILSFVGEEIFGSLRLGVWLYLIHTLSALLTGMLLRPRRRLDGGARVRAEPPAGFSAAFTEAVQSGFSAFLNVCGFVLLFSVLTCPLRQRTASALLLGAAELFSGVAALTPSPGGFVAAAALISWGGLSVHAQALSFFASAGLSSRFYWRGKALQTLLSAFLSLAALPFLW